MEGGKPGPGHQQTTGEGRRETQSVEATNPKSEPSSRCSRVTLLLTLEIVRFNIILLEMVMILQLLRKVNGSTWGILRFSAEHMNGPIGHGLPPNLFC